MKKGSPESEEGSGDLFIYSVRVPDYTNKWRNQIHLYKY